MALAQIGGAVVRAVGHERVVAHAVPVESREHTAHTGVEPREAREEEPRQPRLVRVRVGVRLS
jgi:hypothetical protein